MAQDYAHLSYYPNYEESMARTTYRVQNEELDRTLPDGFPQVLRSKMAWDGKYLSLDEHQSSDGTDCVLQLVDHQLAEIDAALRSFQARSKPLGELDSSAFPLPSLHPILRSVSDNLLSGYGFTVIRGVPVDKYNAEENMIIYVGISSHIGSIRGRQDHQSEGRPADVMIAHITDFSNSTAADDKNLTLAAYTDGEVIFHTDVADIVSLFALSEPVTGGESQIVSSWKIYNELAKTRPDLIKVLADGWSIPSAKEDSVVLKRPLLFYQPPRNDDPERLIIQFSRRSFSGFGGRPQSKYLTVAQAEALDALHFLAEKFHLSMALKKGDMQFINNLSMLHARKSYVDDAEHRRHLLRLWIHDPENFWVIPEPLQHRWNKIYDPALGHGTPVFPLEPVTRSIWRLTAMYHPHSGNNNIISVAKLKIDPRIIIIPHLQTINLKKEKRRDKQKANSQKATMMRWLCLHGTGSSAAILRHQLASICTKLQQLNHTLDFIDADHPCGPAAGIDLHYPDGPYYSWWENPTSVPKIRDACNRLHEHFVRNRKTPYGGVIGFSRGCLLVKSYILFHQAEKEPHEPLPFQAAVFLCGGPVLSVLEILGGIKVSAEAREWDRRTKIALRERGTSKAILKWGRERWLIPGGNGDSDLKIRIPSDANPIDPRDVFGLDTSQLPSHLRIRIPTVHVYGRVDPRLPASMQLFHLCDPETRLKYEHPGGHNIPKSLPATEEIAKIIDQCARIAQTNSNRQF